MRDPPRTMKQLPETLSIDEAVAFMVNLPELLEGISIEEILDVYVSQADEITEKYGLPEERDLRDDLIEIQEHRRDLAKLLKSALQNEIKLINLGFKRTLKTSDESLTVGQIVTSSLINWANTNGIGILGWNFNHHWRTAEARNFTTPFLNIIDEIIRELFQEGGKHYSPDKPLTNEFIKSYIDQIYPNLSVKIKESICTILKPELTLSTKSPKSTGNLGEGGTYTRHTR